MCDRAFDKAIMRNFFWFFQRIDPITIVRDEYLKEAQKIIEDPNTLINVVSRRSKQLKFGNKPLVESLEKLEPEDIALREIIEGKISYLEWEDRTPEG